MRPARVLRRRRRRCGSAAARQPPAQHRRKPSPVLHRVQRDCHRVALGGRANRLDGVGRASGFGRRAGYRLFADPRRENLSKPANAAPCRNSGRRRFGRNERSARRACRGNWPRSPTPRKRPAIPARSPRPARSTTAKARRSGWEGVRLRRCGARRRRQRRRHCPRPASPAACCETARQSASKSPRRSSPGPCRIRRDKRPSPPACGR